MNKLAPVVHPVHELIAQRWSPRAFAAEPIEPAVLRSLLEAARWAPSCFNEQPWSFVVARRDDEEGFARLLGCLAEKNQLWARNAGALVLAVARPHFARNEKPNRHAWHDVGLAVASLTVQATALGLAVHQMAGVRADDAARILGVPDDHDVVTAIAVGRPGGLDDLDPSFHESELAARERRPQDEQVFEGAWGQSATF